ncbi:MAG: sigma-70 family RNA polymerase sigma factor [Vicinamibacterales bacterium]
MTVQDDQVDLGLLVARVAAGDAAAETALLADLTPRVRAMLRARTRNGDLAGDLTQDTLVAVLRAARAGQVREAAAIRGFALGVARNLLANHQRTAFARPTEPIDERVLAAVEHDGHARRERETLLRRALAALTDGDRQVLLLTLVDNLKPAAIAERMGLSAEAARTRKTRALKRVKDELASLSRPAASDH